MISPTESPARTDTAVDALAVNPAIARAKAYLLGQQNDEGYWLGELEADVSVTAGYVPLMYFMGREVSKKRKTKIVEHIVRRQAADGSWSAYHNGPGDLSVTIQTYFGLKMAGVPADDERMRRARDFVLSKGGVMSANIITKVWLAVFGEFDWRGIPTLPPEIILLPNRFPFNIYELSSWARATVMALSILSATKPACPPPKEARVQELYREPLGERRYDQWSAPSPVSWEAFWLWADRALKLYEELPFHPGRSYALRKAEQWVCEHQDYDGSWGGIMLPWVYSLFALKSLGYRDDDPVISRGLDGIEEFVIEDAETMRLQPAVSPVWDTAWAVIALLESGLPADHSALQRAARWLLSKEITVKGDWQVKTPNVQAGCWAFEFGNDWYPDVDDTAVVARALGMVQLPGTEEAAKSEAIERAVRWVVAMQSDDGGWAAFDRNNNKRMLAHIPFGDFITPLDPTSPDITNHAIDLLSDRDANHPALKKGMDYIRRRQDRDGAWFGRWGVNYLYGTGLVLPSLRAAGEDMEQDYIRRAVAWIEGQQHEDGGWGETCRTYEEPSARGIGPSTASQSAWALMGLIAGGQSRGPAALRGIEYLLSNQMSDGSWHEDAFTGTGFPRAFYLRYELYRIYFPLMALARYRSSTEGGAA